MGITGSDVAKDAADMILLTDDFSAIILGIEEGRKIFDNLKKSIAYCLTSNIPELIPFLMFVILRIPLPLSTVLVLAIDLGTDLVTCVSFASEEGELGIMVRPPRKKTEHMVTSRMIVSSYLISGIYQSLAGFLSYLVVMRDFGFPLIELLGLSTQKGFKPNAGDIFDPNAPYYGNTSQEFRNYCTDCWNGGNCDISNFDTPSWLDNSDNEIDLRLWYLKCIPGGGVERTVMLENCRVKQISPISNVPVCFTPDALKYAQTAFFISIVISQMSNSLACKTIHQSFIFSGMSNFLLLFGYCSEIALCLILAFARPLNVALNTRDVIFIHFGIPSIPFSIYLLLYHEVRKILIKTVKPSNPNKPNWFERNCSW